MDFYCPSAHLVIECDGGQHYTIEGLEADRIRDAVLAELERRVLRFDNRRILLEMDGVVQLIIAIIKNKSLPTFLFQRRSGED